VLLYHQMIQLNWVLCCVSIVCWLSQARPDRLQLLLSGLQQQRMDWGHCLPLARIDISWLVCLYPKAQHCRQAHTIKDHMCAVIGLQHILHRIRA